MPALTRAQIVDGTGFRRGTMFIEIGPPPWPYDGPEGRAALTGNTGTEDTVTMPDVPPDVIAAAGRAWRGMGGATVDAPLLAAIAAVCTVVRSQIAAAIEDNAGLSDLDDLDDDERADVELDEEQQLARQHAALARSWPAIAGTATIMPGLGAAGAALRIGLAAHDELHRDDP
jgi:hypothetical protein